MKESRLPKNPNKRPTIINIKRTIERMKARDEELIRRIRGGKW